VTHMTNGNTASNIDISVDADGIATLTLDVKGKSMNVLGPSVERELAAALDRLAPDAAVKGILITSAKSSFVPGYDLAELGAMFAQRQTSAQFYRANQASLQQLLRRLETCGKPVSVAINGLALGGGLELCLASHYRVLADDPKAVLGLPEVKVGLLPGGGGTQRLPRLIGIEKALPLLLEGTNVKPAEALKLGLVDEVVPADRVVAAARRWLLGTPTAQQPWDKKGFQIPGGSSMLLPNVGNTFMSAIALTARATQHNYPAPAAILSAVFEGTQVPIDTALKIESKYFSKLVTDPVSRNLIRTMFINKGLADKLNRRPAAVPKSQVKKLGVLGAGMMGAGVAYVAAQAGVDVVLIDSTQALADKGKGYGASQMKKDLERGRVTQAQLDAVLARIHPTTDYAQLDHADLVIEAVFEKREIKAEVTAKAEAVVPKGATFASNTSTLPISGLAAASQRPQQFIGMHFFSPVDRMPLVEVIMGKRTSEETLARALDFVGQLRKTPIVVNDSRGFYTSRCFGSFAFEGQKMLEEGIDPALIENGARAAGMPVGPLAVTDEVSLELQYRVTQQERADLGAKFREPISWNVLRHFVEDLKRFGRKSGGGFYDYPEGGRKCLWSGLAKEYPSAAQQPTVGEVKTRLLYVQALETARCYEEGVVTSGAEADLGAVLGWGFPAWTGGPLSLIDTVGAAAFVAECQRLAKRHGARFKPPRGLLERAKSGEPYHRAAPSAV
jgi:3-hydroxyacyl-CoA dehydrogenase/enoyl-CoA hydratase/3-hydroxybutyryl-CoA epimerase